MFSVKKFAAFCVVLVCILCFTSCKSKEPEETSGLNSTDLSFAVKKIVVKEKMEDPPIVTGKLTTDMIVEIDGYPLLLISL